MSFVKQSNGRLEQIKDENGKYKTCIKNDPLGIRPGTQKGSKIWTGKRWIGMTTDKHGRPLL